MNITQNNTKNFSAGSSNSMEAWNRQTQQANARVNQRHLMGAEFAASTAEANAAQQLQGRPDSVSLSCPIDNQLEQMQLINAMNNNRHAMAAETKGQAPKGDQDAFNQHMQRLNSLTNKNHLLQAAYKASQAECLPPGSLVQGQY